MAALTDRVTDPFDVFSLDAAQDAKERAKAAVSLNHDDPLVPEAGARSHWRRNSTARWLGANPSRIR